MLTLLLLVILLTLKSVNIRNMKKDNNRITLLNGDMMSQYQYTVIFEPAEEGGYNVVVPAFPEICTQADTLDEARAMALDAIQCVIEGNLKRKEPIPKDVSIQHEPVKERLILDLQHA